ncbi:hypothetical protein D5086_017118 [Populus alba]|uniref:Uncharacterized protein n=1 Tax=Populus alba TaxID=43335 RepID=A0ACC4BXQ0_POPAL
MPEREYRGSVVYCLLLIYPRECSEERGSVQMSGFEGVLELEIPGLSCLHTYLDPLCTVMKWAKFLYRRQIVYIQKPGFHSLLIGEAPEGFIAEVEANGRHERRPDRGGFLQERPEITCGLLGNLCSSGRPCRALLHMPSSNISAGGPNSDGVLLVPLDLRPKFPLYSLYGIGKLLVIVFALKVYATVQ